MFRKLCHSVTGLGHGGLSRNCADSASVNSSPPNCMLHSRTNSIIRKKTLELNPIKTTVLPEVHLKQCYSYVPPEDTLVLIGFSRR